HILSLKKEFFLRKINVYEKTVSQLTIAHSTITNMAILVKLAQNENVTFSEEETKEIFTKLDNGIQEVYKATRETACAIDLYIDLKHDDKEVDDARKFWESLGTLNQLSQVVNHGYDLLSKATTEEEYRKLYEAIKINEDLVTAGIEDLSTHSNSFREKTLGIASQLRQELRKYQ
ncbi:MAG: hypothetical protein ABI581_16215, partial [Sediminibacterium sp.]